MNKDLSLTSDPEVLSTVWTYFFVENLLRIGYQVTLRNRHKSHCHWEWGTGGLLLWILVQLSNAIHSVLKSHGQVQLDDVCTAGLYNVNKYIQALTMFGH